MLETEPNDTSSATSSATSPAPAAGKKAATRKTATKQATTTKSAATKTAATKTAATKTAATKTAATKTAATKTAATKTAAAKAAATKTTATKTATTKKAPAKQAPAKAASAKKAPAKKPTAETDAPSGAPGPEPAAALTSPDEAPTARRTRTRQAPAPVVFQAADAGQPTAVPAETSKQAPATKTASQSAPSKATTSKSTPSKSTPSKATPSKATPSKATPTKTATSKTATSKTATSKTASEEPHDPGAATEGGDADAPSTSSSSRRRRRGSRGRGRKPSSATTTEGGEAPDEQADADGTRGASAAPSAESKAGAAASADAEPEGDGADGADGGSSTTTTSSSSSSRRRRRRRRSGDSAPAEPNPDDPPQTVVKVREPRPASDDVVAGVSGSTRLEAKKQRRRDGRDQARRRTPLLTEAEFLARREAVERRMVVRQHGERTQIAVLEDGVVVEHYVTQASHTSYVGNVYLGRVQNVLPAMEAAFVDIGKGRNGVLYAGEVAWARLGLEGKAKRIENVLKSGDPVLVQVTKDPIGHKGARLTGMVSLPGRFLVYAPGGSMSGISRKLPENERNRLKAILKKLVPDEASVIIRTAAEGASEEEITRDVRQLEKQWAEIEKKQAKASAPAQLYAEPDLAIKVVRDMFNEDIASLVVSGDDAWDMLHGYVEGVAPDLVDRLTRWTSDKDVFKEYRVDEQLTKALDRKVFLPSGGSLVIDRTEAMTVIDVNTGKFTGSGGSLEETVTKNNLEAAEEIVRQIRLRDIGGIIVIDFIDMVLERNRDLVMRRLVECLGRDRTRHQVAEVTSLGLVQMTRKRVGQGLLEAFSEPCDHCGGRGVIVHSEPVTSKAKTDDKPRDDGPAKPSKSRSRKAKSEPKGEANSDGATPKTPVESVITNGKNTEAIRAIAATMRKSAESAEAEGAAESELETVAAAVTAAADDAAVATAAADGPTNGDAPSKPATSTRSRRRVTRPAGAPAAPVG